MKKEQYLQLKEMTEGKSKLIMAKDLSLPDKNRTLLYGYTCQRSTFHVYLKDGEIKVAIYDHLEDMWEWKVEYNNEYIPDKRIYPERSDFEFVSLLMQRGVNVMAHMLDWHDASEIALKENGYYGYILEEKEERV